MVKGFNQENLTYMRKFYLAFPKCGTLSLKIDMEPLLWIVEVW